MVLGKKPWACKRFCKRRTWEPLELSFKVRVKSGVAGLAGGVKGKLRPGAGLEAEELSPVVRLAGLGF
jgi:hypothetical protein